LAGTLVQHQLRAWGAKVNKENIDILQDHLLASSPNDLYWQVGARSPRPEQASDGPNVKNGRLQMAKGKRTTEERPLEEIVAEIRGNQGGTLTIGEEVQNMSYKLSAVLPPHSRVMTCSVSSRLARASASTG
jgi:hypothetical protein